MPVPALTTEESFLSEPQRQMQHSDLWLLDSSTMPEEEDASPTPWSPPVIDQKRYHYLSQDPDPGPGHNQIWRYTPVNARRLFTDVQSVADPQTFIGRILLVVARGGDSKNFEEITGQDGLTFGITDFAGNAGCIDFFRSFYENYPDVFIDLFGANSTLLLDPEWIVSNNGGGSRDGNNRGLIRFRWLREGLAQLLSDRRFWGFQLAQFVQGKVNAAVQARVDHGLRLELTVAAMVGIANSYGATGMRTKFLEPALAAFPATPDVDPIARELDLTRSMLRAYAERELATNPATQQLFDVGLFGKPGALPSSGSLAHRGSRVLATLMMFPPQQATEFTTLGRFRLDNASRFAGDPTTA